MVHNPSGGKEGSSKNKPKEKFTKAPKNQRETRDDKEKEQTKSKPAAQGRGSKVVMKTGANIAVDAK